VSASEAFERDLLAAAGVPSAAASLAGIAVDRVVLAVCVRGVASGDGDPIRVASLVARVQHLLAAHVGSAGRAHPSGTDVALATVDRVHDGIRAATSLIAEVEGARPAEGHRHAGLLGVGLARGPVLFAPDGRVIGLPAWRAVRLAMHASARGEFLVVEGALEGPPPEGMGVHAGRAALGFPVQHLVDYR
jgi:hypothetical protein